MMDKSLETNVFLIIVDVRIVAVFDIFMLPSRRLPVHFSLAC